MFPRVTCITGKKNTVGVPWCGTSQRELVLEQMEALLAFAVLAVFGVFLLWRVVWFSFLCDRAKFRAGRWLLLLLDFDSSRLEQRRDFPCLLSSAWGLFFGSVSTEF